MDRLLPLLTLLAWSQFAVADDWPQWLGRQRDAVWRETGIIEKFPEGGPKLRWRAELGGGFSGPAVADGRVYVTDRQMPAGTSRPKRAFDRADIPGTERVLCFNESDGRLLWKYEYDCPYSMSYSAGPRTTPVIAGGKVYTLGGEGDLLCLDAVSGKLLWERHFKTEYGARTPMWGFSSNPLLDGDKLICVVGGEGSVAVAFNKDTGKEIWRALSAREPGYAPPMIYEAGGKRQLIIWHPEAVNSLDPETGGIYWSEPFKIRSGLSIPTPRKLGDLLIVSSFYNGSMALRFAPDKPAVTKVWQGKSNSERNTDGLHSIIATPFAEAGHLYGVCSYGQLRCLKADTGERVWETLKATTPEKETRWATAFLIKNGDRFFLPNERGELIIAKLSPSGYDEISRAKILEPTDPDPGRYVVWSHPAFANRSIYARNDKEIVCYSLASEPRP